MSRTIHTNQLSPFADKAYIESCQRKLETYGITKDVLDLSQYKDATKADLDAILKQIRLSFASGSCFVCKNSKHMV